MPSKDAAPWLDESPRFATTRWTVVELAGREGPERKRALDQFCRTYWFPVYAFVRRGGQSPEDARDLTQEFFARLLEKEWLGHAERRDGARFSTLLLTMVKRFLINEHARARSAKRGGGEIVIDFTAAEDWLKLACPASATPERIFERHWALAVLEAALVRLRKEADAAGKVRQFEVLSPFLSREPGRGDYDLAGAELDLRPRSVAVAVHRLRHRYRGLLREELSAGQFSRGQVDEEMRHLFAALA